MSIEENRLNFEILWQVLAAVKTSKLSFQMANSLGVYPGWVGICSQLSIFALAPWRNNNF